MPARGAALGTWGYDRTRRALIDPSRGSEDFMSYCDPTWISDYNYQKLVDRIALMNSGTW